MLYAFYNAQIKFLGAVYNFNLNGKKQIKTRSLGFMMTLFACYSTARRAEMPTSGYYYYYAYFGKQPAPCCLNYYYFFFHYKLGNMVAFILPTATERVQTHTQTHAYNQRQQTTYKSY